MFGCFRIGCVRKNVETLDWSDCQLEEVPSTIEKYKALEELLLANNQLKTIPNAILELKYLRILDISDNQLYEIPKEISQLVNLVELNASRNMIDDLPPDITQCRSLEVLDLSNPIIDPNLTHTNIFPACLTEFMSLRNLRMNKGNWKKLPESIGNLVNLRVLELRENNFEKLPDSMGNLKDLEVLDIGYNMLDTLPDNLGGLESLKELYLDYNLLSELPDSIVNCTELQQLDLSENSLSELPESFGDLVNLEMLVLSLNELRTMPDSIGKLQALSVLKVDNNKLFEMCPQIGNCTQLTELILTGNNLTKLPREIGHLEHLIHLDVSKNLLVEVPTEIGDCKSLSILSFRSNNLTTLPMEIGKCSNLRIINVAENKLRNIPFTFQVLENLIALWIGENQKKPLIKLQTSANEENIKVLTCYLLPQEGHQLNVNEVLRINQNDFVGGPKVGFSGLNNTVDEDRTPASRLERQDTPIPRNIRDRKRGNGCEEKIRNNEISIVKKTPDTSIGSCGSLVSLAQLNADSNNSLDSKTSIQHISIKRDETGSLGLSFVSRADGSSIHENDSGIYISKVERGNSAEEAGLKIGDKMIRVNGTDISNLTHSEVVSVIQIEPDTVQITVLRNEEENTGNENTETSPPAINYPTPVRPIVLRAIEPTEAPENLSFASRLQMFQLS